MSERESPEPADEIAVVVDDMDEFIDRTRYQQLFEARSAAMNALRDAPMSRVEGRGRGAREEEVTYAVSESTRAAVAGYVLEAEPLYQNTDIGQELWRTASLGPLPISDVAPNVTWGEVETHELFRVPESAAVLGTPPNRVKLSGIGTFLEFGNAYLQATSNSSGDWRGRERGDKTEIHELLTPPELSEQVFRVTNHLLTELGVGLQSETSDENEAETDYSDIVDSGFEG